MGNIIIDVDITQFVSVPSVALLIVSAVDDGQIVIPAVSLELFPNLICLIFGSGLIEARNIALESFICSPEARARTQIELQCGQRDRGIAYHKHIIQAGIRLVSVHSRIILGLNITGDTNGF